VNLLTRFCFQAFNVPEIYSAYPLAVNVDCWLTCKIGRVTMRDSSFWNITVPRAMSLYANMIFVVLWIGFVIAMSVNRGWLDLSWNWVQTLPSLLKIIAWVMCLPVMVGLWIWTSSWSTLGNWLGFAGLVAWTLLAVSSLIKAFR